MGHRTRIMYIENKGGHVVHHESYTDQLVEGGLTGPGRIGLVTYSKTGASLYCQGRMLQSLKGKGFKSNYFDAETGEHFWVSGPKKRGGDALYATNIATEIDDDVREEYWTEIRKQPERKSESRTIGDRWRPTSRCFAALRMTMFLGDAKQEGNRWQTKSSSARRARRLRTSTRTKT